MAVPLIVWVGVYSQAMPLVAILATRGRNPPAPYRQLALLCCAFLLSEAILYLVSNVWGYNLWVAWFMQPIEVGLTLWLLSLWQPAGKLTALYMSVIPIVGCLTAILLLLTDPMQAFDPLIAPLLSLVALVATLHTLVHRTLVSMESVTAQPWFWITGGLSLFWLAYIPVDAFVSSLFSTDMRLAKTVLMARMALLPIAFSIMTWGVLCRRFQAASLRHS